MLVCVLRASGAVGWLSTCLMLIKRGGSIKLVAHIMFTPDSGFHVKVRAVTKVLRRSRSLGCSSRRTTKSCRLTDECRVCWGGARQCRDVDCSWLGIQSVDLNADQDEQCRV